MNQQILSQKQEMVSEIKQQFENAGSAVVVEYRGLSVAKITQLRRDLLAEGVDLKVYKNTMARRAVEGSEIESICEFLTGPNAIAFSSDAIAPSRVLAKFAKKNKELVIKSGIVEGKVVDLNTIKQLSELPGREGMLSMLLGALKSPMRDLAWAVKQLIEQQGGSVEETKEEVEETQEVSSENVAEEVKEGEQE